MNDALKIYTADPELATLLKAAARTGARVRVKADEETYLVHIEPEAEGEAEDIWEGYDPEQVRAAVRRSVALGSSTEPADLDPLIAEIRAQRDQVSRHPHS